MIGWRHRGRPGTRSTLKSKSTSWPRAAVAANCQNRADLYQHNSSLAPTSSRRPPATDGLPSSSPEFPPPPKPHQPRSNTPSFLSPIRAHHYHHPPNVPGPGSSHGNVVKKKKKAQRQTMPRMLRFGIHEPYVRNNNKIKNIYI